MREQAMIDLPLDLDAMEAAAQVHSHQAQVGHLSPIEQARDLLSGDRGEKIIGVRADMVLDWIRACRTAAEVREPTMIGETRTQLSKAWADFQAALAAPH